MTRARLPFLASYRPGGPPLTLAEKFALEPDLTELEGLRDGALARGHQITPEEARAYATAHAERARDEARRGR